MPKVDKPTLISDNGTQFTANDFEAMLSDLNIDHVTIIVRNSETNVKIEAFYKTIKHENVYLKEQYQSFYEAKQDINNFIEHYSYNRLHQGINFVTPYQRYAGKEEIIISKRKKKHKSAIERKKRLNRQAKSQVA